MENSYSYSSYPESGESSPRSREVDFENPSPWEEQQNQNYKVKLICSYGGKILPRPHDNQLCYTGGETKILAVDRSIKLPAFLSRLSSLSDSSDVSFKYQLPGEDLDALISVTNDDDLDHMMHEYDRLYRASPKPARMRLFLFPLINHTHSFGSDRSDRDRFVDALNSGPALPPDPVPKPPLQNNVDFIPGWAKGAADVASVPPPTAPPSVPVHVAPPPDFQVRSGVADNRVAGSDPGVSPVEFQRQLQDLQRLQIGDHPDHQYTRKSDDNLVVGGGGGGGYGAAGDYYNMQKVPEKLPPVKVPPQVSAPAGYWPPEKNISSVGFPGTVTGALPEHQHPQQPMYMISAGGVGVYHAPPMVRSVTGPTSQGYYHMQQQQQRIPSDVYRDQPVYGAIPQPLQQTSNLPPQAPKYAATYAETTPYSQVAYDSVTGRQVYYTAQGGGVVQQPQQVQQAYSAVGPAAVTGEMRVAGGLSQEGKVVGSKIPQTSV